MAVKFLINATRGSFPPEEFTAGQVVADRGPEWEAAMVRRNLAAYQRDGKLYDIEGKEVAEHTVTTEVVNVSDNRDEPTKGDKLADGTPQRASSGPGDVVMKSTVKKPADKDVLSHETAGLKRKK